MRWLADTFRRLTADRLAAAALALVAVYTLLAVAAPLLSPYDPYAIDADAFLAPPSASHWLGTDQLGRDVLSRVIHGARVSLRVAGLAVAVSLIVGGGIGLLAGYLGGWTDKALSRATDVLFAVPEVLLALVMMAVLGRGLTQITIAIAIVYTPIFVRVTRAAVLRVRTEPYVEAARALSIPARRIMLRHVLPNAAGPVIVQATLSLGFAILAEAALSFLGLSGEIDVPSWGLMLQQGKDLMELAWWVAVFPGIAITLAVLALNLVGDGLRDVLDPKTA